MAVPAGGRVRRKKERPHAPGCAKLAASFVSLMRESSWPEHRARLLPAGRRWGFGAHSVVPYLGVGYGNVWTAGVNFYFDLGVMFQGTPQVSLNCSPGAAALCAGEEERVREEVKRYKYYPVLNLGITIGF